MFQAILALLAVVVLSLGGFGGYEKIRADRAESHARIAEQRLALAKQRADDLARLWTTTLADQKRQFDQQQKDDDATFAKLQARASALARRLVSLSARLDGLLRADAAAANAHDPAARPEHHDAPAAVPEPAGTVTYTEAQIAQWATAAAQAYADAWNKWHAAVAAYDALRQQQMEQPHEPAP